MKEKAKPNRTANYVFSLVAAGVLIYLINKIPHWNFSFVRENYTDILLAANISLGIQAALSFVLIFYHPLFQHHLANFIMSAVGIYAISVILRVFPVDFSEAAGEWLNVLFRIGLIVSIVGSSVGAVFHFMKFLDEIRRHFDMED